MLQSGVMMLVYNFHVKWSFIHDTDRDIIRFLRYNKLPCKYEIVKGYNFDKVIQTYKYSLLGFYDCGGVYKKDLFMYKIGDIGYKFSVSVNKLMNLGSVYVMLLHDDVAFLSLIDKTFYLSRNVFFGLNSMPLIVVDYILNYASNYDYESILNIFNGVFSNDIYNYVELNIVSKRNKIEFLGWC